MSKIPEESKDPISTFLRILQVPEGQSSQPSLQRLKELRKLLAELQLENSRLVKKRDGAGRNGWSLHFCRPKSGGCPRPMSL